MPGEERVTLRRVLALDQSPRGGARAVSSVRRRLPALVFTIALVAALVRALAHGATAGELGLYVAGFALLVLLPGWALATRLGVGRDERDDLATTLGLAVVLGWTAVATAFLALQACGVGAAIVALPLAAIGALVLGRKDARARPVLVGVDARDGAMVLAALGVLALVVVLRAPLYGTESWLGALDQDLWFHAGNASALSRGFPPENPRVAGEPLVYHVFSYVPSSALRVLLGLPIESLLFRLGPATLPLLLLLQTFNAARAITGRPWAGVVAAALVVLHSDPIHAVVVAAPDTLDRFGLGFLRELDAHAFLHYGVFRSPTTCLGLVALATLAERLHRWFERGDRRELILAAAASLLASGAKGSVLPVAIAGLALVSAWEVLRGRSTDRAFVALVVVGLAAAPMTVWIALGEHSFAQAMFRPQFAATARGMGLADRLVVGSGGLHGIGVGLAFAAWLALYLGVVGLSAIAAAWARRRELVLAERWLAMSALTGLALACAFVAPGESQLFFAYDADLALALLAAAGATAALSSARGLRLVLVVGCVPMLAAVVAELAWNVRDVVRAPTPATPAQAEFRAALAWIREHAPEDAVVLAKQRGMFVSVLAERSAFYETEAFSAGHFALTWEQSSDAASLQPGRGALYYRERHDAQRDFLRAQDPILEGRVRAQLGSGRRLVVLLDRLDHGVVSSAEPWPELDVERFELGFENSVARVWVERVAR